MCFWSWRGEVSDPFHQRRLAATASESAAAAEEPALLLRTKVRGVNARDKPEHARCAENARTYLGPFGCRHPGVLVGVAGFDGAVAAVGVPEGRRDDRLPRAGGRLLVVAGSLEYDGEAVGRRRVLHVPLPELGQRPALVLRASTTHGK